MAKFEFKLWQVLGVLSPLSPLAARLKGVPVSEHLLGSPLCVFVAWPHVTRGTQWFSGHTGHMAPALKDEKYSRSKVAFDPGCPVSSPGG